MVRPPLSLGSGGYPILQLIRLDKVRIEPERDGVGVATNAREVAAFCFFKGTVGLV
jgi:hypothetical protein